MRSHHLLHHLLLYLYPSSFRSEYGEELSRVFRERRETAGNVFSICWLWITEFSDILTNAAGAHWDVLRQDLRYTVRTLARVPGFTLTAIVVTGLGIGANTAAFSITDHVLLHPFSFSEPDRLVQLWQRTPAYAQFELSPPNFYDWRKRSTSFEYMAAYTGLGATFLGGGEPQRLDGTLATTEFFKVLRVKPALGRVFNQSDGRQGAPRVVIISAALWQSRFGGAGDILSKSIRLDDNWYNVIGVMAPDFFFPSRTGQFWTPLILGDPPTDARDNNYLEAVARLKPGVSMEQARSEMAVITDQLAREFPKINDKLSANVFPLREQVTNQTRLLLWALFGASACVLLIACTNLANLLLTRATARRKELAVRAAIGAGRERLVRQLLTESLVLALAGGALGVVVAIAGLPLLSQLVPPRLPIAEATVLNGRVFAFAALITLATGIGFGVIPALRLCKGVTHDGLQEGSRSGIGGRREWIRSVLVVAEITASLVLLVSAGLLIRALWRVQAIDPGFHAKSALTVQIALPMPRYSLAATRAPFYDGILSNVRALPGVSSAGFISFLPMIGIGGIWPVAVAGPTDPSSNGASQNGAAATTVGMRLVSPGYFDAMGIPLRSGRDIGDSDGLGTPLVAVVSESFVRRYFPNQDPIGRTFHFDFNNFSYAEQERTIVGVVGDVRFRGLERQNEPQVYMAAGQLPDRTATFYAPRELVVRLSTDGDQAADAVIPAIRRIIQKADPEMPITAVRTLTDVVDLQTAYRSRTIRLVASFAALSLLLAGIGIHGLLSFVVGQRGPEFGLRIALGAQSRDILSMVLREGVLLAAAGTALGLMLSYAAGRSMQALLAGLGPFDPATVVIAAVTAFAMTLSGSLVPAIRAMRTDPTTVIRGE